MIRSLPLRFLLVAIPVALLLVFSASKSEAESDAVMPRVRVLVTDTPGAVEAPTLTIRRAELLGPDGETVPLFDEPREVDLSALRDGLTPEFADEEVPPGTYVHLRLYLAGADDAHPEDISLPRLDLDASGETAVVTLDLDAPGAFVPASENESSESLLPTTFRVLSAEIYR